MSTLLPAIRLMRTPVWPRLSAWNQHQCLRLLANRHGLFATADAVDSILQATLARHGEGDEPSSCLYLGQPLEADCLYFRSVWTGWRYTWQGSPL